MVQMKKRTVIVLSAIAAILLLATTGATAAGTHWFGLGNPQYSRQMIRGCNDAFYQIRADQAEARRALANLDPSTAHQWLLRSKAGLHEMKLQGCPLGDTTYPLRNHG
jgi:hypothetical protein